MKKLVVITGLSGAGKSASLKFFEDRGYYCIDNLPCTLIPEVVNFFEIKEKTGQKLSMVVDLREEEFFDDLEISLNKLVKKGKKFLILFLEAHEDVLVKRYEETRRPHPLEREGLALMESLKKEKEILLSLKEKADITIDTSNLNIWDLRKRLEELFEEGEYPIHITLISFGFKYGLPPQLDLLFDVRFIPNPFYEEHFRFKTGLDKEVIEFVTQQPETKKFLKYLKKLLEFLLPLYKKEGKSYLTMGFGCTGGAHRAVVLSEKIRKLLTQKGYAVSIQHRDLST